MCDRGDRDRPIVARARECKRWRQPPPPPSRSSARIMTSHGLLTDMRHVIRRLVASPSFSLVAVLSLGLGIGANTAVVSVARAGLFGSLPIERPQPLFFA